MAGLPTIAKHYCGLLNAEYLIAGPKSPCYLPTSIHYVSTILCSLKSIDLLKAPSQRQELNTLLLNVAEKYPSAAFFSSVRAGLQHRARSQWIRRIIGIRPHWYLLGLRCTIARDLVTFKSRSSSSLQNTDPQTSFAESLYIQHFKFQTHNI